nr:RidA family protein [Sneathiella chungangensis]
MSQAVKHNQTIYLAGQVGSPKGTIKEQTKEALEKVEKLLAAAGSEKSKILQATIWLASMNDFDAMNEVYDAWIDPNNPPARACGEAKLAAPEYLFEIIVVAAA